MRLFRFFWFGFLLNNLGNSLLNLPDERISGKLLLVNDFSAFNAGFGQPFSDINGVNVLQSVLFFYSKKTIFFNQIKHTVADFLPGNVPRTTYAIDRERWKIIAVLLPEHMEHICAGSPFPQSAHNGALA